MQLCIWFTTQYMTINGVWSKSCHHMKISKNTTKTDCPCNSAIVVISTFTVTVIRKFRLFSVWIFGKVPTVPRETNWQWKFFDNDTLETISSIIHFQQVTEAGTIDGTFQVETHLHQPCTLWFVIFTITTSQTQTRTLIMRLLLSFSPSASFDTVGCALKRASSL